MWQKKHSSYLPQISNHSYRILIFGGSGSGKTKALLGFISHQPEIEKMKQYSYKSKYQLLINKCMLKTF